MNEKKAREILKEYITEDNSIRGLSRWTDWDEGDHIIIDGAVTLDQLKAICWWMENKEVKRKNYLVKFYAS